MKIGIDIGSVATKCVLVKDKKIIASTLISTGTDSEKSAEFVFAETLRQAGIRELDAENIVCTGYGAYLLSGCRACLALDVGGQDTKVIEVNQSGAITDFLMNDKCAAGTGRFLEIMSNVLESNLETMSELALKAKSQAVINATCSVFAESEVVSLIAQGTEKAEIAAGLFHAISTRIAAMLRQFEADTPLLFCGGAARSKALKIFLERTSGRTISVLDNPQFVVAFGAALS